MTAAEVLLRSGCRTLPVDLGAIAKAYGIRLISYAECVNRYELSLDEIYGTISHLGFSFHDGESFVCAVNENACGGARRRWTTAHELSHVLLGHVSEGAAPHTFCCEREADSFTAQLLAPLSVLHFCGVASLSELERLTGLSAQAAQICWDKLSALRRRDTEQQRAARRNGFEPSVTAFAETKQEKQLLEQFLPFIAQQVTRRIKG